MPKLLDPKDETGKWPFEYINAANTDIRSRMPMYQRMVEEEKARRQQNVAQFKPKIKVKP